MLVVPSKVCKLRAKISVKSCRIRVFFFSSSMYFVLFYIFLFFSLHLFKHKIVCTFVAVPVYALCYVLMKSSLKRKRDLGVCSGSKTLVGLIGGSCG